jgi:anti-sigma B factor antagonist
MSSDMGEVVPLEGLAGGERAPLPPWRAHDSAINGLRVPPIGKTTRHGKRTVIELQGELDLHNAHQVRDALQLECGRAPRQLVIDLSAVTFLDSTAIHVLVNCRKQLPNRRGLLVVVLNTDVRRTLLRTGIDGTVTGVLLHRCQARNGH